MSTITADTRMLPVDAITRGKSNPNGRVQGPAYDELREDVRRHGVLQAVLVRRATEEEDPGNTPFETFFLIAGHRRLQAAIDTMQENIPAVVIASEPASDDELRLIENIHRADLDPVTEAEAYRGMVVQFGADGPEEIATRVGKSPGHVRRRLSLLRLPKSVLKALAAGELQLRVAELVGSVDDDKLREKAAVVALHAEFGDGPSTVSDMRRWLAETLGHKLNRAPWDLADEALVTDEPCRGACRDCAFNTANQGELFGDAGKEAACMNAKGWQVKTRAFFDRKSQEVKKAGGTVLTPVEAKALSRDRSAGRYVRASETCMQDPKYRTFGELAGKDMTVRALGIAEGEIVEAVDAGAVLAAAKERGVKIGVDHSKDKTGPTSAQKRERAAREKQRVTVARAIELVVQKAEADGQLPMFWAVDALLKLCHHDQAKAVCMRRGWVPVKKKGQPGGWSPRTIIAERVRSDKWFTSDQALGLVVEILATPSLQGHAQEAELACKAFGVNWQELLDAAEAAPTGKLAPAKAMAERPAKPPRGERPRKRGVKKAATKKAARR